MDSLRFSIPICCMRTLKTSNFLVNFRVIFQGISRFAKLLKNKFFGSLMAIIENSSLNIYFGKVCRNLSFHLCPGIHDSYSELL